MHTLTSPLSVSRYEIVPRQAFFTQHFPAIFPSATCYVPPHPHTYSLVTAVLALGTYFDISQPISEVKPKARALYQLVVLDMNIIRAALDPYRLNSVQGECLRPSSQPAGRTILTPGPRRSSRPNAPSHGIMRAQHQREERRQRCLAAAGSGDEDDTGDGDAP
jgi:hypothetical protein